MVYVYMKFIFFSGYFCEVVGAADARSLETYSVQSSLQVVHFVKQESSQRKYLAPPFEQEKFVQQRLSYWDDSLMSASIIYVLDYNLFEL